MTKCSEFINVAAHELRTPIQPILSLAELLRSKIMDSNQHELLDVIIRNAKRLQRLSDNILDVTRIESGKLKLSKERFDLSEKIHNIIKDVKTQISVANDVQITLSSSDQSETSIFVEADKVRIFQVISNLLSNAIKFTDKEGTVSISLKKREGTKGENKKEEEVIVSISDSGAGIPSEIRHRLFSKFATKSESGTGLGLFISKSIVEAHGGKIWVENNASGRGPSFYFTLPLANS
jgi:signal transduction histidine kinase